MRRGVKVNLVRTLLLEDAVLRHVLDAWREAAGGDGIPDRRLLDPVELGRALPHTWLCERTPGSRRFRYRLAGERINDIYRRNLAGLYLDEIIPAPGIEVVQRRYAAVVDTPAAARTAGLIYLRNDRTFRGERLILPLVDRQSGADLVLGATVYELARGEAARQREQTTRMVRLRPGDGKELGWVEDAAGERSRALV